MSKWSERDLAYFAGIIDGEGCISLMGGKHKQQRYGTTLFVGNTDARLIHWVHERFGGFVGVQRRINPKHKDLWRVTISGAALEPVLIAVLPYLVLKHEQAALMLEFRTTVRECGANTSTPQIILDRRADLKTRMSSLNHRGVRSHG